MNRIGSENKYTAIRAGLLSALMMLIIMLPSMLMNHGVFIIRGDYVDQYIPRVIKAKEILATGGGTWDWYNYLGNAYNKFDVIFSLNGICLLLPSKFIPNGITVMHIVRVFLIACITFLYLKKIICQH